MIMRNTIQQVTAAGIAVCGLFLATPARADASRQEWRFDGGSNPAAPEVCDPPGVTATATVTPGQFSSGWQSELPGLGTATGFWDLGRSGAIVMPVSTGPETGAKTIRVRVTQWVDGGIFSVRAGVTVAGATFASERRTTVESGPLGGWEATESEWTLPEGQTAGDVTITGAPNGSLVDSVVVAAEAPGASVVLAIRRLSPDSDSVELSWPAAVTGFALEGTASLSEPDWQPVPGTPQVVGDRQFVNTLAGGSAKFFRLRKP
jgi:hypothetical protein